jgi:hypothetical protein
VDLQLLSYVSERPPGDLMLEPFGQLVQRLDEDLRVADLPEGSAGVAEAKVLFAVDWLANLRPDQAQDRPDPLERLPRLVDGLVPRALARPREFLQSAVHLLTRDSL